MAALHEEVDAMLLRRDRIGIVFWHALDDLDLLHIELVAARSPLVCPDLACDDNAGFLGKALQTLENLRSHAGFVGHALDRAGAIAKDGKDQLAALAHIVQPAL